MESLLSSCGIANVEKKDVFLEAKKRDLEKIRKIIDERNIKYLIHFTTFDNIRSILRHGILPLSMHPKYEIQALINDYSRIDCREDCTSFSIGFPNYRLLYTYMMNVHPGKRWAMLIVDASIILDQNRITFFCHSNAARVMNQVKEAKDLCFSSSFEDMFSPNAITPNRGIIDREVLHLQETHTTDPQAELLISERVDVNSLKAICFKSNDDLDHFKELTKDDTKIDIDLVVVRQFFRPRRDYEYWR